VRKFSRRRAALATEKLHSAIAIRGAQSALDHGSATSASTVRYTPVTRTLLNPNRFVSSIAIVGGVHQSVEQTRRSSIPREVVLASPIEVLRRLLRPGAMGFLVSIASAQSTVSPIAAPATAPTIIATPAAALSQMEAALRAGDMSRVSQLLPEPAGSLYAQMDASLIQVGIAKQKLIKSLDQKFPDAAKSLTFIPDDAALRATTERIQYLVLLEQKEDFDRQILNVLVARPAPDREVSVDAEQYIAIKQERGWRVAPFSMTRGISRWRKHNDSLRALPAELDQLASRIAQGAFANGAEAVAAIRAAVGPVNPAATQPSAPLHAGRTAQPSETGQSPGTGDGDNNVRAPAPDIDGGIDWTGYFKNVAAVLGEAQRAFKEDARGAAGDQTATFEFDLASDGQIQNWRSVSDAPSALDRKAQYWMRYVASQNHRLLAFPGGTSRSVQPGGPLVVKFGPQSNQADAATSAPGNGAGSPAQPPAPSGQ
jgi:hypothetical protein